MSKATKRKYVTKEVLDEFAVPDADRQVAKVLVSRGNNLHEVTLASGEVFLVSMPTKFRKNVWIKRGDFVMVESIAEGDKVKAEISHILYKPQIQYIRQQGLWPAEFDSEPNNSGPITTETCIPDDMLPPNEESDEDSDSNNADLVCNPNRRQINQNNIDGDSDTDEDSSDCNEDQSDKAR